MDTYIVKEDSGPVCSINRRLLPVKGVYFTFLSGIGDLLLFIPVYMKQIGLSSIETGIIYGVMPFLEFFVQPLFGAFADKSKRHKFVLMVCCIMTGVCHCLLLAIPAKETNSFIADKRLNNKSTPINEQCKILMLSRNETLSLNIEVYQQHEKERHLFSDFETNLKCNVSYEPQSTHVHVCTGGRIEGDIFDIVKNICDFKEAQRNRRNEMSVLLNKLVILQAKIQLPLRKHEISCEVFNLETAEALDIRSSLLSCNVINLDDCDHPCSKLEQTVPESDSFGLTFWCFFVIYLLGTVFYSPVLGLIDAIAYGILGESGRGDWGKQRLWGTAGLAIFAVASTFIMDTMGRSQSYNNYTYSFYIFLFLNVLTAVIAYFLEYSENLQCHMFFKSLSVLLKDSEIVAFLVLLTMFGILKVAIDAFLFWYLKDLGSSQIILGLCILCNSISEMIVLQFAGKFINMFGYVVCFYLALVAYALRFFSYSFLTNPWYVLFIEPLKCLCFGLMYAVATGYASKVTPPGMSATMQGLVGGLVFGLGRGIGSILTGKLFDPRTGLGAVWTFRLYGCVSCATLAVYVLLHVLVFKKKARRQESTTGERKADEIMNM